jgi:uncharacterized protein (DUF2237 family)
VGDVGLVPAKAGSGVSTTITGSTVTGATHGIESGTGGVQGLTVQGCIVTGAGDTGVKLTAADTRGVFIADSEIRGTKLGVHLENVKETDPVVVQSTTITVNANDDSDAVHAFRHDNPPTDETPVVELANCSLGVRNAGVAGAVGVDVGEGDVRLVACLIVAESTKAGEPAGPATGIRYIGSDTPAITMLGGSIETSSAGQASDGMTETEVWDLLVTTSGAKMHVAGVAMSKWKGAIFSAERPGSFDQRMVAVPIADDDAIFTKTLGVARVLETLLSVTCTDPMPTGRSADR